MTGLKPQPHIPSRSVSYANFTGIDRSLEREAMELKNETPLWECFNATCDWRGSIVREPRFFHLSDTGELRVDTIKFYNTRDLCWAEADGDGVALNSSKSGRVPGAYPIDSTVTMAVFRGSVLAFSAGRATYKYNGSAWSILPVSATPAFGVAIQNRLAVAGIPDRPTEVLLSRVNKEDVFPDEEPAETSEKTKAAFIDIRNLIGTADEITGLGAFEVNRLAIFTRDQCIVYAIDPDFTKWEIDQRANLRIGCISHRTIVNAGSDLLFCSRHGVHSVMRSDANGMTITTLALSRRIERLYKQLVRSTEDLTSITACYDQDDGLYTIFFPRPGGSCVRLALDITTGYDNPRWTQGDSLNARCGDALAGRVVYGTPGGIYELAGRKPAYLETANKVRGAVRIRTGILWHSDQINEKISRALKIQAVGKARLIIRAYDEEGIEIKTTEVDVEEPEGSVDSFPDVPLSRMHEIPFAAKYRGVQFSFETDADDDGDLRLMGFAVELASGQR